MEYLFDLHEDLPTYVGINGITKGNSDLKNRLADRHADLPSYKKSQTKVIIASFFPFKKSNGGKIIAQTKEEFAASYKKFLLFLEKHPEFEIVKNKFQIEEITKNSKIGLIFHIEGLSFVESASDIDWLYNLGFRSFGLTWNHPSQITGNCLQKEGLSSFGKEIVKKIYSLDSIIDLTHSSKKTFWDIKEETGLSKIFYSHSTIEEKNFFHPQAIDKKMLEEIKKQKGIVGITFLPSMYKKINLSLFNTNIIRLVHEGFEDVISFGTDYFGFDFNSSPKNMKNIESFTDIYRSLKTKLSPETISKIFNKNAKNFLKRNLN